MTDELPPLPEPSKGFGLDAAIEHLQRIQKMGGSRRWRLVVRKFNPGGMSGHGTTEVDSIAAGFDWEAGRVVITPAKPMTELTPEDVEAITKSVRAGGSWHAYKSQEKLRERALKAEARVAELEMQAEAAADQLRAAVLAERLATLEAVNALIKDGPFKGNGYDDLAQNNGVILAANLLASRVYAIRKGTP